MFNCVVLADVVCVGISGLCPSTKGTKPISNVAKPTRWTLLTKTIRGWWSAEETYSLTYHKPSCGFQTFVFCRHESHSLWAEKSINKYDWGSNSELKSLVPYPKTARFPHTVRAVRHICRMRKYDALQKSVQAEIMPNFKLISEVRSNVPFMSLVLNKTMLKQKKLFTDLSMERRKTACIFHISCSWKIKLLCIVKSEN